MPPTKTVGITPQYEFGRNATLNQQVYRKENYNCATDREGIIKRLK